MGVSFKCTNLAGILSARSQLSARQSVTQANTCFSWGSLATCISPQCVAYKPESDISSYVPVVHVWQGYMMRTYMKTCTGWQHCLWCF